MLPRAVAVSVPNVELLDFGQQNISFQHSLLSIDRAMNDDSNTRTSGRTRSAFGLLTSGGNARSPNTRFPAELSPSTVALLVIGNFPDDPKYTLPEGVFSSMYSCL